MPKNFVWAALIGACLALQVLSAQLDQLSANDKDFIEFAGEVDLTAIRLGRMAQMDAASPQVKRFALTIEQEHTADLKKLTAIANKTGGVAPNTLDDVHMNTAKRLNKLKGQSFDHAFLKAIVNQHENALVSFKREADHGFNQDLQAYAKAMLPKLEQHLKIAKQLSS